ncbi:porin [Variovorax sp. PAMC 28711]|uniref:porin n=1 Tax=Variovorax sp. PAMC 28711 TaxID=1795631 RepID=UPI00078CA004|nr:porin [Variovorax sp. PAMC 28711]AMM23930.1 porin [Variovorax sp. PAMC 28711]
MKKSLIALAALAVASVASAQSSVTLFGVVDASISGVSNKADLVVANPLALINNPFALYGVPGSAKTSKTGLNNSAYNSSRIGFRGTEDLGGGLAAGFWLEGALANDEGASGGSTAFSNATTGQFNRRSTVSLSGGFGEIRLGRDYKPTFWNLTVFDPFGTNGSGTSLIQKASGLETSNVRAGNTVGYFLPPNLGGFYGQVQYAFSEQLKANDGLQGAVNNNSRGGRYVGGRFGYANGPLDVAVAYSEQNNSSSYLAGTDNKAKDLNVGASYDFGVVKLYGIAGTIKNKVDYTGSINAPAFNPSTKMEGYQLGLTAPIGAGLIRASYGHVKLKVDQQPLLFPTFFAPAYEDPKADQFALGYVYNLSKRTALYATGTYVKNKNGAAYTAGSGNIDAGFAAPANGYAYRPKTSIGYDFGVRHAF